MRNLVVIFIILLAVIGLIMVIHNEYIAPSTAPIQWTPIPVETSTPTPVEVSEAPTPDWTDKNGNLDPPYWIPYGHI